MTVFADDARSSSITRSFRFESDVLNVLDEEAKRTGISVNALVGIILRRYVEFTRYLSKIDMVVINREVLTCLIDLLGEEELYNIGIKLGRTVLADTIMFWKKETTEKAVMEYIEKMVCRYGRLGTYDERRMPGGQMAIVVRHRLGKNGSRFLEGYLHEGLKHTLGIDAIFEITDSSVKCEIPARR
ncbi:MAG: hypothetical protein K0S84_143 [Nitrososphaera sp.]|jgi:hypothetical protein|nr:hypothetical protein [Nitrososphaera sp.]MDP8903125.1 hypothetical protein [Thermoproteota archaeon]